MLNRCMHSKIPLIGRGGVYVGEYVSLFIVRLKVFFSNEAEWAHPVVWQFFEGSLSGDPMFRVSCGGIVYPVTYGAFILLHSVAGF